MKLGEIILPRLIRIRDAPSYLGMDKNRFNQEVRPYLMEIPIGDQGVAFDRLDLDAWVEDYKSHNGRPGKKGGKLWDAKQSQVFFNGTVSGTSTKSSGEEDFVKALERAVSKKPNST